MTDAPRVLVLEDQVILAFTLRDELEKAGIAVVDTCCDVESALATITLTPFDVGILDVDLGQGKTCEPVAQALLERKTPFFFVTGYSGEMPLPEAFGGIARLLKPVQTEDVAEMVHQLAPVD